MKDRGNFLGTGSLAHSRRFERIQKDDAGGRQGVKGRASVEGKIKKDRGLAGDEWLRRDPYEI